VVPFVLFLIIGGAAIQIIRGNAEAEREQAVEDAEKQAEIQRAEAEQLLLTARSYLLDAYENNDYSARKAVAAFNAECAKSRFATGYYSIEWASSRGEDGSGFDVEVVARPGPLAESRKSCTLIFGWKNGKHQHSWQ
jgi:hypothetical protein